MNSRITTWIVLAILLLKLGYGCFLLLQPFFSEIFLALVLVIVFYPVYSWLERKTGRPNLASWICTLGTGILFLVPVTILGVVISQEMKHALDAISSPESLERFDRAVQFFSAKLGWDSAKTNEFIQSRLSGLSSSLLSNALKSIQGLGSWVFSSVVTLTTMFFLFRGGRLLMDQSKHWIPLPTAMVNGLFEETRRLMFANVYGVLAVALAQGALTTVGFWMTGLPSGIFWGSLAALLSVLPFIGAGLIWIPAVIYLASIGALTKAGILLAWGLLVVSMADNVIRPIVLSESARMNTAIMIFALLGGIDAFGLVGLFAGPIVISLAIAVAKLLKEYSTVVGLNSESESISS